MKKRFLVIAMASTLTAVLLPQAASAQTPAPMPTGAWPNKPIKLIVQFAPGGTTDIIARTMSARLSQELGQPVVVENRPGAAGALGSDAVAKAAPDGYTIGMATVTSHAVNPAVFSKLPYDVMRDLSPITRLVAVPNVMVINPNLGVNTMAQMVALAKSKPGKVSYGSAGQGSEANLMGELFNVTAQVQLLHVPYRGSAPAIQDAMGGTIDAVFDNLPSSLPFIQSGKLKALAVASNKRLALLPDVPTFAEVGLTPVNESSWFGLVAPAKTPADIINRIQAAAAKILAMPEVRTTMANLGSEPVGNTPEEFTAQLRSELVKFKRVADGANIKLD
jgi:tripartite-type tricarboxylate transporter receptor subunit TctC